MRATSPKRSTRGHGRVIGGVVSVRKKTVRKDLTVPAGTPDSGVCEVCHARLPRLMNGRLKAHAAGGTQPNIMRGEYKCEGSGYN